MSYTRTMKFAARIMIEEQRFIERYMGGCDSTQVRNRRAIFTTLMRVRQFIEILWCNDVDWTHNIIWDRTFCIWKRYFIILKIHIKTKYD